MVRSSKKSAPIPLYNAKKYRQMTQRHMTDGKDDHHPRQPQSKEEEGAGESYDNQQKLNLNDHESKRQSQDQIFSEEFLQEYYGHDSSNNELLVVPNKKKQPRSQSVELTVEEIKEAKRNEKALQKKLQTLQVRHDQKRKREQLYTQLQQHSIVNAISSPPPSATTAAAAVLPSTTGNHHHHHQQQQQQHQNIQSLLIKSSQMNTKFTKRQRLQRALRKEQMQIPLTPQEQELLYDDIPTTTAVTTGTATTNFTSPPDSSKSIEIECVTTVVDNTGGVNRGMIGTKRNRLEETSLTDTVPTTLTTSTTDSNNSSNKTNDHMTATTKMSSTNNTKAKSFAEQMMASIAALQHQMKPSPLPIVNTNETNNTSGKVNSHEEVSTEISEMNVVPEGKADSSTTTSDPVTKKKYIPSSPIVLQTTPSYATTATTEPAAETTVIPTTTNAKYRKEIIRRPSEVQQIRMELPVVQMEYEIMELITNHDICIICSETGSGKSTQIPQFLYEAGYSSTVSSSSGNTGSGGTGTGTGTGLIGVTQPRRVAAMSSAKRVCYEMGMGDGQSISKSNVVSYQTRYESAGYSDQTTEIQFMTDGILLQEIRNDLLLRKYSVIILDEAHERNLNTDILIGLLSIAIPLRNNHARQRKDDATDTTNENPDTILRPLKLIIMSATLRVEDFTTNTKLFHHPQYVPGVITIPGRTFPVIVHHNKVTELYNYGTWEIIFIVPLFQMTFVLCLYVCTAMFLYRGRCVSKDL